jgi:hypothetical protein
MTLADLEYKEAMRRFNILLPTAKAVCERGGWMVASAYATQLREDLSRATRAARTPKTRMEKP